jgi:hypothetical protein
MNNSSCCKKTNAVVYAIGILGAVAVVGLVVAKVSSAVKAPDLTEARRQERLQVRGEIFAATSGTLTNAALIDADRQIYRIPVESAKEITLREWKNPAAGRKALLDRLDKATAKLPEKANPFE